MPPPGDKHCGEQKNFPAAAQGNAVKKPDQNKPGKQNNATQEYSGFNHRPTKPTATDPVDFPSVLTRIRSGTTARS